MAILLLLPFVVSSNDNKGYEIAYKIEQANRGFGGEVAEIKMVLIDAQERKVERIMTSKVIERAKREDRSLLTFSIPKDIKGTKILTWKRNYPKDNDQWIYLPSYRRSKRIQGGQRSNSFMGSEFSYEDIGGGQSLEKFNYKFLSEVPGVSWKLELIPKTESGYSKKIVKYSAKYMNPVNIDYYNRRGELQKTATFLDWKSYKVRDGIFWRANRVEMKNIKNRKTNPYDLSFKRNARAVERKGFQKNLITVPVLNALPWI